MRLLLVLSALLSSESLSPRIWAQTSHSPWPRHTIDASFRGADGVRLADFNGDGRQDIVTGWEESGVVRLYLHPGIEAVESAWPAVTVGRGASPEDAVPLDIDGDGRFEIVSCHEGGHRRVLLHSQVSSELLAEASWRTTRLSSLDGQRWMFAVGIELRGGGRAMVLGSKGEDASITLVDSHSDVSDRASWPVKRLRDAGWIMSLRAVDMDGDGDQDVLYSDRKGSKRGVGWLEQPDRPSSATWTDHVIGGTRIEPMFLEGDQDRVLLSTRNSIWLDFRRNNNGRWTHASYANPKGVPNGKAIARLGDGIVLTSNTDSSKKVAKRVGVWFTDDMSNWTPISHTESVKLDRIECVDLDGDGDLDVLTCEERKNQGVIWFENPAR